jgi:exosome complex component RRP43
VRNGDDDAFTCDGRGQPPPTRGAVSLAVSSTSRCQKGTDHYVQRQNRRMHNASLVALCPPVVATLCTLEIHTVRDWHRTIACREGEQVRQGGTDRAVTVARVASCSGATDLRIMQADAFKRLYPEQYFARFIQEGVRPDGRPVGQARPTTIGLNALSSADGSALVKIGSTTALACIKLEVYNPQDGNEKEGNLQVNVELTPLCSPDYRPGRQPEAAQFISSRVNSLLQKCKVVDQRQLCILESRAAWMVNVDVFVLDANGSVLDAVLLAVVSALSDLSLPAVSVTQDGNVARADSEPHDEGVATTTAKRLQLLCHPMYLSLGVYKDQMIADPTKEEEPLLSSSVQVALDEQGNILGTHLQGRVDCC